MKKFSGYCFFSYKSINFFLGFFISDFDIIMIFMHLYYLITHAMTDLWERCLASAIERRAHWPPGHRTPHSLDNLKDLNRLYNISDFVSSNEPPMCGASNKWMLKLITVQGNRTIFFQIHQPFYFSNLLYLEFIDM
jgi:hypothetical protein